MGGSSQTHLHIQTHKGQYDVRPSVPSLCTFRLCVFLMFPSEFCAIHLSLLTAVHSSTPVIGSPWTAPPSSSTTSNPWASCANPRKDPWDAAPVSPSPVNHEWDSPTDGGTFQKHQPRENACCSFQCLSKCIRLYCLQFDMQMVMGQIRSLHRKRRSLNKRFLKCPPLNLLVPQVV